MLRTLCNNVGGKRFNGFRKNNLVFSTINLINKIASKTKAPINMLIGAFVFDVG